MPAAPLISVILSFRNEEAVLPELIRRLQAALKPLPLRYELIFVNDVSSDRSLDILLAQRRDDPAIKIITMSRRWGVTECTLAGLAHARGEAAIMMDSDLQDPPELLPQLIERWQAGAEVVHTIRTARAGESAFKLWLTRAAYRAIRALAAIELPVDAGDFKLLSRRALNALLKLQQEQGPYLRGLVKWIGFRQAEVCYERQPRGGGETHYSLLRSLNPFKTFVAGVTSFSIAPLYVFLLLGMALCVLTALVALGCAGWALSGHALPGGWWLGLLMLGGFSLQGLGLGVLGVYVGRMHQQTLNRPLYIVDTLIGFDP